MNKPVSDKVKSVARQQQFLRVIGKDEAAARFRAALQPKPLGSEPVPLSQAHGRVLAENVVSQVDVPGFDRANVDGFAVRAVDTCEAMEESPRTLSLNDESLLPGCLPRLELRPGTATPIATGGMIPRGADAVLMIEDSELRETEKRLALEVRRAVSAGQNISFAGSDIARGETVLWRGTFVTSREIGVLAAIGETTVTVFRAPRVAIISTGDEVVEPGDPLPPGCVYDSNAAILSAAVRECGGIPTVLGRVKDDFEQLMTMVANGLEHDVVVLSGGTSKGAGDISYRVVERFQDPGIVAHGVALKPGKPICLAVTQGKPVVVLPGFPTSAIFTFHEFVAPVIRTMAGLPEAEQDTVPALLPQRIHSDRGRTEYSLVRLFHSPSGLKAFPIGKGSGSVTAFSQADGFITIPQHREILDAGDTVDVTLLDRKLRTADLVAIGSHCVGLDILLGELRQRGRTVASLAVGSLAGLGAVRRGECDLAGIHLFDPVTGTYNRPFLDESLTLIPGYRRMQCLVFRPDDARFAGASTAETALAIALADPECVMVNRNPGSGTRLLSDGLLARIRPVGMPTPTGYANQVKSHNAVAAAVAQGRADWGIAIDTVARSYGLEMIPMTEEQYDFVIRKEDVARPILAEFRQLLDSDEIRRRLKEIGFGITEGTVG